MATPFFEQCVANHELLHAGSGRIVRPVIQGLLPGMIDTMVEFCDLRQEEGQKFVRWKAKFS